MSIRELGEKYTPLALLKITCPFDSMRPKIWLGLASFTRFSVADWALGWLKRTCALAPTLKLPQSTTARALLWLTTMLAAWAVLLWLMLAAPCTTCPPVGNWLGAGGAWAHTPVLVAQAKATAANTPLWRRTPRCPAPLPALRAVSGTGTMAAAVSDHSRL